MYNCEILEAAIKELQLMSKGIKRQERYTYDGTLFRAWAKAITPSLIDILEKTIKEINAGRPSDLYQEEIKLALTIIGETTNSKRIN